MIKVEIIIKQRKSELPGHVSGMLAVDYDIEPPVTKEELMIKDHIFEQIKGMASAIGKHGKVLIKQTMEEEEDADKRDDRTDTRNLFGSQDS